MQDAHVWRGLSLFVEWVFGDTLKLVSIGSRSFFNQKV